MGLQDICGPIIEVDVMAVKEENLWVDIASSAGPTEETLPSACMRAIFS